MLMNDQPLAAPFFPNGGMPAIELHDSAVFHSERKMKSQRHPSDVAPASNFQVVIGRELAG